MKPDPMGEPRNGFQVYLLCVSVVSSASFMLGISNANAVEEALPHTFRFAWAIMLGLGAVCTLAGMYWPFEINSGLLIKKFGLFVLSVAALVYGLTIVVAYGEDGFFLGCLVLGFAGAAFAQFLRVNKRIRTIIKVHES